MKLTVVFGAAEQCLRVFLYKIFVLRQNKMPMRHKDVAISGAARICC